VIERGGARPSPWPPIKDALETEHLCYDYTTQPSTRIGRNLLIYTKSTPILINHLGKLSQASKIPPLTDRSVARNCGIFREMYTLCYVFNRVFLAAFPCCFLFYLIFLYRALALCAKHTLFSVFHFSQIYSYIPTEYTLYLFKGYFNI
jgi:hypothetical protein